jgi:hypothetical protein
MLLNLDSCFKELFQKDVQLTLKNKPYKKGKLINFKLSGCYLSLVMLTEKKKETFEIPFPYAIKTVNGKLVFDYTLSTLAEQDYDLHINLKSASQVKNCKFYNTILSITSLN